MLNQTEKRDYTEEEKKAYIQKKFERFNTAYEEAASYIATDADEKINQAKNVNKKQVILYTFYFMQDKNLKEDLKGTRISFGDNVRLYDILTKGKNHFLRILNKKFNEGDEKNYHTGYFRRVNPDGNGFNEWNVYVSWREREERVEDTSEPRKNHNVIRGFKPKPFKKNIDGEVQPVTKKGFGYIHSSTKQERKHFQKKTPSKEFVHKVNKDGLPTWVSKVKGVNA